jgi:hypothetical protein
MRDQFSEDQRKSLRSPPNLLTIFSTFRDLRLLTFDSISCTFKLSKSELLFLSFVMKWARLSLIVLVFLSGSCASSPKPNIKETDWGSRIGTYTYEEALAELGEPDVIGESNQGRAAEWVVRRSPMVSFGFGFGTGSYGGHTATGVGVGTSVSPPPSGEYLRLRFDKDGKLAEWSRVRY